MRLRNLFLFLTMFSALILAVAAYFKYHQAPPPMAAQIPMAVAPIADVSTGALLKPTDLMFVAAPTPADPAIYFLRKYTTPGAEQDATDRATITEIVGAVVRRHMTAGQPFDRASVAKPGDSGFLAAVLQPGMEAITIGVTAVSGAGGLIFPGDRVDVILTQAFNNPDVQGTRRWGAETVTQDVRVLAIDQQLQATATPNSGKLATTVTLEMSPRDAQRIALASKLGDLSLTIRSLLPSGAQAPASDTSVVWAGDVSPALKDMEAYEEGQKNVAKPTTEVFVLRGGDAPQTAMPEDTPDAPISAGPGAPREVVQRATIQTNVDGKSRKATITTETPN